MKRKFTLFAFSLPLLLAFGPVHSQIISEPSSADFKNIVKVNVSSLFLQTFSFQYERILGNKTTALLGIRMKPSSSLPFKSYLNNNINEEHDESVRSLIYDSRLGGLAITPEFRYYFGKSAGKGFYLGPFLRYENFGLKTTYLWDDEGKQTIIPLKGNLSVLGIGLLIGTQFRLSNSFTLDWWIAGPYYTSNTLNLHANNLSLTNEDRDQLAETLEGTEIAWFHLTSNVSNTKVDVRAKGGFTAVRAFGICLGYKF